MPLAQLSAVPRTPVEMQQWAFANVSSHRDIARRIFETKRLKLVEYPLEPFDPNDPVSLNNFLNLHADMHQQMDKALGLPSYALSEIDWADITALAQWISQHYVEHQAASSLLGVS
jgi:hypothetical protein